MQSKFQADSQKFGPAQNILGPLKGQGIRILSFILGIKCLVLQFSGESDYYQA